jgi:uncharacterized protein (DUF1501 family)
MAGKLTRRAFIARSTLLGCSAAASPLLTPVSFAAAPWDTRLVVIILRGGMDGLDVIRPYGDPMLRKLRRNLSGGPETGAPDLDGFYALHPALAPLMPLWDAGQLGFINAVSTPYRDKRSHFDGQDILEAGTVSVAGVRDGWLNRMLQAVPGVEAQTAFALGRGELRVLTGDAPVADWSPEADLAISPQAISLAQLIMAEDPAFGAALAEALSLSENGEDGVLLSNREAMAGMAADMNAALRGNANIRIAEFAAERLRGESRVAAFSLNGWDTHNQQERSLGRALKQLSETILALQAGTGPAVWDKTAVIAMTEFGRTARQNGTRGTDHGTGGAMVLAGGAVRGGRVHGQWPGLDEASLYDRRDLMPLGDVRTQAAWVMRGLTGLDRGVLEGAVFPGIDMGSDPGLTL